MVTSRKVGGDDVEIGRTSQRGRLRRSLPGLPGRPGAAGLPELDAGHRAVPVLRAGRGLLRRNHARVVPDGGAPARGPVLRRPADPRGGRPAGAAARPRIADGGPDPRAQQPGRRRRAGDRQPARAGRRDARQAPPDRRRQLRARHPGEPHRAPAARGGEGRQGAEARPAGHLRRGRTRSATGWRTTASAMAGSSRPRSSRPASTPRGWRRSGTASATPCSSPPCAG